ncbi:MAG: N-methyl-D-aspartate receptor NMDAR2C subunit [Patescibacteria group bacterium]|nr:N-methyl-D-aspartate receptor NMDAR2C subunit [Patescibacteria group bacterium]
MSPEKRWYDFWIRCPATPTAEILHVRSRLWRRYREPQRAYHNLDHIEACLAIFDQTRNLALNPMVVEMAIWFHDAVYDSKRKDNEDRSAVLAGQEIVRLGGTADFKKKVRRVIRATKHNFVVTELDDQLMCDIDLAGFGKDADDFDADGRSIRQEYAWVPAADYAKGRSAILQSFLDRPHIYYLPYFRERYELPARKNLARTIAALEN